MTKPEKCRIVFHEIGACPDVVVVDEKALASEAVRLFGRGAGWMLLEAREGEDGVAVATWCSGGAVPGRE